MKTFFAALALVLLASHPARAQNFSAPARRAPQPQPRGTPAPITTRDVTGVVPRALRGGNPVQMLNPRAPARYGTAEQSVLLKPDGSGRWNGIKLFTINF